MGLWYITPRPEGWKDCRLRFLSRVNPPYKVALPPATEVSFVPMAAVGEHGGIQIDQVKLLGEVGDGYTPFRDGDVVIAKITPCFENGKGAIAEGLTSGVAFGTTELHVVRPGEQLDRRFLYYLTASDLFRELGEGAMYGAGGQKRVPEQFIKDFRITLPSLPAQRKVADLLERKTAEIDTLIEKKRRLLDLLAEKRTALITRTVTKGLDADVPMKDSGIEWLGDIPAHWDVARLKNIAQLESGHTPSKSKPEFWVNCDIPWVSLRDTKALADNDYIGQTHTHINRAGLEGSSARLLPAGTVIFTRDATVGLAAITEEEMAVSQHLIAWIPSERVDKEYLLFVFEAMREYLHSLEFGSTVRTIGMDDIRRLVGPVPPLTEQLKIVDYFLTERGGLTELETRINEAIEKLKEYRSALITNAVTGQIKVA